MTAFLLCFQSTSSQSHLLSPLPITDLPCFAPMDGSSNHQDLFLDYCGLRIRMPGCPPLSRAPAASPELSCFSRPLFHFFKVEVMIPAFQSVQGNRINLKINKERICISGSQSTLLLLGVWVEGWALKVSLSLITLPTTLLLSFLRPIRDGGGLLNGATHDQTHLSRSPYRPKACSGPP